MIARLVARNVRQDRAGPRGNRMNVATMPIIGTSRQQFRLFSRYGLRKETAPESGGGRDRSGSGSAGLVSAPDYFKAVPRHIVSIPFSL